MAYSFTEKKRIRKSFAKRNVYTSLISSVVTFAPTPAPMTQQAIYEPMLVFNPADSTTTPWLATKWKETKDGTGIYYKGWGTGRSSSGSPVQGAKP